MKTGAPIDARIDKPIAVTIVGLTRVASCADSIEPTKLRANMAGMVVTMRVRLRWTGQIESSRLSGRNAQSVRRDPSVRSVLRSLNGPVGTEACPLRVEYPTAPEKHSGAVMFMATLMVVLESCFS